MHTVDLRGVGCPTNFVKAKLAIEMADSGDIMEFYLDEGEPVENVARSLKNEGHRLLKQKKIDGYYILNVEVA
jgi:TusA-related sulfurtransferase